NSLNKRILKYAVSLQVIPFNPARDIIVPRRKAKEGQKLKYLDDDNLKKILDLPGAAAKHLQKFLRYGAI
ncbi:hypothetical protein FE153_11845, partial [Streptococcus pneumoniae]